MQQSPKTAVALKYFANTLYYLVLGLLIVIVLLVVLSQKSWTGNYRILVVQSGSMEPAIHTGALVIVKPEPFYQPGDVVTYRPKRHSRQTITHRIQQVKNKAGQRFYITKGDANEDIDFNPVPAYQVLGKVVVNLPYAGYAVAAAKTKWGLVLLIIVPAMLVIIDQSKRIWREFKKFATQRSSAADEIKKEL